MKHTKIWLLIVLTLVSSLHGIACSILYYIDHKTGNIYFVNNEDYWYDVKPYIHIIPGTTQQLGRIWYGWKSFGQGGVNEKGLVLDGAVTPEGKLPEGYTDPKGKNITDDLLSQCETVQQAIDYLEREKIALRNAHIFLGDRQGRAVLLEWVNGVKQVVEIQNNRLVATNFNLSDTNRKAPACWRYPIIQKGLDELDKRADKDTIDLKAVGNVMGKVVQLPQKDSTNKTGGTLYTTFIDLTAMRFVVVYKLDNSKIKKFDILAELHTGKRRKLKMW